MGMQSREPPGEFDTAANSPGLKHLNMNLTGARVVGHVPGSVT